MELHQLLVVSFVGISLCSFRVAQADARQVLNLIADGASFEESLDGRNSWMQER